MLSSLLIQDCAALLADGQAPERKERPLTNFLSGLLSFIAIFAALVGGAFVYAERQVYAPGPLDADKIVLVRGSTSDVIDQLEQVLAGFLDSLKDSLLFFTDGSKGSVEQHFCQTEDAMQRST